MSKKFNFKDLLSFEAMLFPKIATICYFVMVGISILFGFIMFIIGIDRIRWGGGPMIFVGLLIMTIGPVFIRLWFEVLLVLFKIYDRLCDIPVIRIGVKESLPVLFKIYDRVCGINNKLTESSESADTTRK